MRERATAGIFVGVLLAGLAVAGPCLGADEGMQLRPRALWRGDTLSVTAGLRLDAGKKVFVRLLGPSQIHDLPADASQVSRGRLRVATEARGGKGAGPVHPGFENFITTGGVLAPERLQFFLWTVIGVFGFVTATLAQDPATVTQLPKAPDN